MENTIEKVRESIEAEMRKASAAIQAGKLKPYNDSIDKLKSLEKAYNGLVAESEYAELAKQPNPIEACIKKFSFIGIRHVEVKSGDENKTVIGVEAASRELQFDLLSFCAWTHSKAAKEMGIEPINTDWQYTVSKLNQLLCLRAANTLKMTDEEIEKIAQSYYLRDKAREIKMGGTPTSNTQLLKAIQQALDAIIFKDDGAGKNAYKVNNHDVAYVLGCYTRHGKKPLTLAVSKDNFFRRILMEVCLRVIEDGRYTVDGYKKVKA